ncbi:MAG: hypothetical protein V2I34_01700 [Bacteroidales bacterium]|jgi:hypothetical protein|nr:hypothetical protein [Bacteroidales bacterium]
MLLPAPVSGQDRIILSKFEGELKFDGIINEAGWDKITAIMNEMDSLRVFTSHSMVFIDAEQER